MPTDPITPATIRFSAMNFLAMREHSAKELQQKLNARFEDSDLVAEVVNRLGEENLQSDERFCEAFIAMRARQGKGPVRILLELKDKGVATELIDVALDAHDACWFDLAAKERVKRFGSALPQNMKDKSRQIRFLQYRGFNSSQINSLFK